MPCTITLASTRKRVRFCCSVKPSQLWWGLLPICTINEIFRTIPLAFRRLSVCVCLVGFASIAIVVVCGRCVLHRLFATTCKHPCLKPLGTHAKASLPLYERSVGFASLQSLWAFISGVLALLAPPVAPNTAIPTTIAKPHYPSKSTISLPPLSKVRCCRPKKFGRLPEGLLYTHQPLYPHNLLKSTSLASHHPFAPHPSISHYSSSNIHFLPAYP